jgi:hypothetical protein
MKTLSIVLFFFEGQIMEGMLFCFKTAIIQIFSKLRPDYNFFLLLDGPDKMGYKRLIFMDISVCKYASVKIMPNRKVIHRPKK